MDLTVDKVHKVLYRMAGKDYEWDKNSVLAPLSSHLITLQF